MKKAFFFSLMTFMLLFSIFLFSADYIKRDKQLQSSLADSRVSNKIVYIEDDISHDALFGLTGIGVNSIARQPSVIVLNFSGGSLGENNSAKTAAYAAFVSHNYSVLSNLEISLVNFSAGFYVQPYGSRYALDGNRSSFTTSDYLTLRGLDVVIGVPINSSHLSYNSTPSNGSGTEIRVRVHDSAGESLMDSSVNLDPALQNAAFLLSFDTGAAIELRFGDYGGAGSLVINATGLAASIEEIIVTYDYTAEPVVAEDGLLSIYSPIGKLTKESEIVLKRG